MQIATWNDFEEGTEVESGIDNCYTNVSLSLPPGSSVMSWSLVTNGDSYATKNTIHHFALWVATQSTSNYSLKKQLARTATSFDLSTLGLTTGTYTVFLEAVGQPSMQNEMSSTPATYKAP